MNGKRRDDEFEALPFAAGEMDSEGGAANGFAGGFSNGPGNGAAREFDNEFANEWQGEDEGGFEDERGRMPTGGRGGGRGMGRGGARPVYHAGARPGRGPVARPSRPQGKPYPGPRPGRGPRGPYWGPFYGGWPGGVVLGEPIGYLRPGQEEPAPPGAPEPIEAVDFPAQDSGDDGGDGGGGGEEGGSSEEIPPEFSAVVGRLALPGKPAYTLLGSLMRAPALIEPKTAGFYLIVFPAGRRDGRPAPAPARAHSGSDAAGPGTAAPQGIYREEQPGRQGPPRDRICDPRPDVA
jgi:hypothetical protein